MTRLGVVGNRRYDGLGDVLDRLRRRAPELGIDLAFEEELSHLVPGADTLRQPLGIDALMTLGGDGTMLRGARLVGEQSIPILGVNLGRLGFLTACGGGPEELESALEHFMAGDYVVQRRMALAGSTSRNSDEHWRALNDVVVHKGGFARVVHLKVWANGELIGAYAADGLIISTPTGSTAYSLSAGGPVVVPTVESIVLTPISAHTLAIRSVVLPPDAEVAVRADDGPEELLVTVDGQVGTTFTSDDTLLVRRAERPVLVVNFRDTTFFSRMRRKLDWGGLQARDENNRC